MKNIISDSIWAHMGAFWLAAHMAVIFLNTGIITPVLFVIFGVVYVLIVFNSAMRIADFEMSELGKVINKAEKGAYKEIHIIGMYKNESN